MTGRRILARRVRGPRQRFVRGRLRAGARRLHLELHRWRRRRRCGCGLGGRRPRRQSVGWLRRRRGPAAMAERHPDQRLLRFQGADQHLCPSAGRPRASRSARPGGALLAGVRPGGQAGHHRRDGAGASVRRHRTAHSAALGRRRRLGRGVRPHRGRRAVVGARHRAGLSHGDLRFHPRRAGPPGDRAHRRAVPAHRGRRAARHRRAHRPAKGRARPLRRDDQQTAHPRCAGRRQRRRSIRRR